MQPFQHLFSFFFLFCGFISSLRFPWTMRWGRKMATNKLTTLRGSRMKHSRLFFLLITGAVLSTIAYAQEQTAITPSQELRLVKTEKSLSYYEGSVVVSGIYHEKIRESEIGNFEAGLICFTVQGPTIKFIPHEDDAGFPWFCFSNTAEARTALKMPRVAPDGTCYIVGTATVQISKYVANNYPSEVHDKANLDKVIVSDEASFKKECSLY